MIYVKIIIMSLALIMSVWSCKTYQQLYKDIDGIYTQVENPNLALLFSNSNFLFIDQSPSPSNVFKCCDTITYGVWKADKERGFLKISSAPELSNYFLPRIGVIEKATNIRDSLYLYINNPVEQHYKKNQEIYRELSYAVYLETSALTKSIKRFDQRYDDNQIVIPIDPAEELKSIELHIYIKGDIPLRNTPVHQLQTPPYRIQEKKARELHINLPDLNYGFLAFTRHQSEYIKVTNAGRLEWNGAVYAK